MIFGKEAALRSLKSDEISSYDFDEYVTDITRDVSREAGEAMSAQQKKYDTLSL